MKAIPPWLRGGLKFSPDIPEPRPNPPPPTEGTAEADARMRARGRGGRRSTILTGRGGETLSPTGPLAGTPAPQPMSPGGGLDGSVRPTRGPMDRNYA